MSLTELDAVRKKTWFLKYSTTHFYVLYFLYLAVYQMHYNQLLPTFRCIIEKKFYFQIHILTKTKYPKNVKCSAFNSFHLSFDKLISTTNCFFLTMSNGRNQLPSTYHVAYKDFFAYFYNESKIGRDKCNANVIENLVQAY